MNHTEDEIESRKEIKQVLLATAFILIFFIYWGLFK